MEQALFEAGDEEPRPFSSKLESFFYTAGMKLAFLGPAGVGKGTQAERAAKEKNLVHISTGLILREALKTGSQSALRAKEYMDKGMLVPDQVVINIIEDKLQGVSNFVLDGFPRTLNQATALANITDLDKVLYFNCPERIIIDRLSGRRVCKECGANYHLKYVPPKKENHCDKCGGELYQRSDDNVSAIRLRFKEYNKTIVELLDYYEAKGKLIQIDASKSPDLVYQQVIKVLPVA